MPQADKPSMPTPGHKPSADPAPAAKPAAKPDLPKTGTGTVTPDKGR